MQRELYEFAFSKKYVLSARANPVSDSTSLTTVHAQTKGSLKLPFVPTQGAIINPVGKVDGVSCDLFTHKFELIFQMSTFYTEDGVNLASVENTAKFTRKICDQCEHALSLNIDIYIDRKLSESLRLMLGQLI
jgi:hypothetical protein